MIIWCHVICWRTTFSTILLSCLCNRQCCLLVVNIDFLPGHCLIYELNQTTNQPTSQHRSKHFFWTHRIMLWMLFLLYSAVHNGLFWWRWCCCCCYCWCCCCWCCYRRCCCFDYLIRESEHKMVEFYMHDTILISKRERKKIAYNISKCRSSRTIS